MPKGNKHPIVATVAKLFTSPVLCLKTSDTLSVLLEGVQVILNALPALIVPISAGKEKLFCARAREANAVARNVENLILKVAIKL